MPKAAQTLAVIDFETTGISPGQGARATEIAAVRVSGGRIVDRYASLMRSGPGSAPSSSSSPASATACSTLPHWPKT